MREWEIYDKVLRENGFNFEDEFTPSGFSNSDVNYLKYTYTKFTDKYERYDNIKVYFNRKTDEVTHFHMLCPDELTDKIKGLIKIELRNHNIDSILKE